jgi:hypothetical protein
MKTWKLTLGIVSTVALTLVTLYLVKMERKNRVEEKLLTISDAGYETAYDILYPLKHRRLKLH